MGSARERRRPSRARLLVDAASRPASSPTRPTDRPRTLKTSHAHILFHANAQLRTIIIIIIIIIIIAVIMHAR
jgi:hypothetical protein